MHPPGIAGIPARKETKQPRTLEHLRCSLRAGMPAIPGSEFIRWQS